MSDLLDRLKRRIYNPIFTTVNIAPGCAQGVGFAQQPFVVNGAGCAAGVGVAHTVGGPDKDIQEAVAHIEKLERQHAGGECPNCGVKWLRGPLPSDDAPVVPIPDYMDTPHYRVNKFVATQRILGTPRDEQPGVIHGVGPITLTLADLEAVVQASAPLFTGDAPKMGTPWRDFSPASAPSATGTYLCRTTLGVVALCDWYDGAWDGDLRGTETDPERVLRWMAIPADE